MLYVLCHCIDFIDFLFCKPRTECTRAGRSSVLSHHAGWVGDNPWVSPPPLPAKHLPGTTETAQDAGGDINDRPSSFIHSLPFYPPSSSTIPGLRILSSLHCPINRVSSSLLFSTLSQQIRVLAWHT